MTITLIYLVRGGDRPSSMCIDPHEYFDPLEPGESWKADGVPRYSHAHEYLSDQLDLEWTELEAPLDSRLRRVREVFSPDGRVTYWHCVEQNGYEELCISSQVAPSTVHITRLHRQPSQPWVLSISSLITDLPDGSQEETLLFSSTYGAPASDTF
jgi:hypothetical protein